MLSSSSHRENKPGEENLWMKPTKTTPIRGCKSPLTPTHLPYHDRESKDACEVVQQLEDNLKECLGVWQAPDGDEGFHCPVVTADVAGRRRGDEEEERRQL